MAVRIVDGLWLLPVSIPIPSLSVVNVYAFELSDGSVGLIDTGWDDTESMRSLVDGLSSIGFALQDVSRIAVTHAHPDHLGLANQIQSVSGAPTYLYEGEAARLRRGESGTDRYLEGARRSFPRWGVPVEELDKWVGSSSNILARSWEVEVERLANGEVLDFPGWNLEVIWTPGHSSGHMCLYESNLGFLFSGDHVLPRITPGIGMDPSHETDPLGDFLDSLALVADLNVQKVLPAHEYQFSDLRGRVEAIKRHHEERLNEIVSQVTLMPKATAWEVAKKLTWSRSLQDLPSPSRRLALAETQSHLVHLCRKKVLARESSASDQVERWSVN